MTNSENIGTDRLVNQKAASHLYGVPSIVIDYGTATTIDVMDENYHFLGGLILPGVSISLDALVDKTSKLPQIELDTPKKLIGNSTKECMQNGIYFLNRMGVESIVSEIIQNYFKNDKKNQKVTVIATGGLSNYLAKTSPCFQHIHSQLNFSWS